MVIGVAEVDASREPRDGVHGSCTDDGGGSAYLILSVDSVARRPGPVAGDSDFDMPDGNSAERGRN